MALIKNQTLIACTPEQLFDYCVDNRNEVEWNPTAVSVEKLTVGPVGLGTRFLAKWKGAPSPLEVECLEFDRPRRWVSANRGPVAVRVTGTVEPAENGSRLSFEFDARPTGWFRVVFPLFLVMMRRQEKANMTYLREALERRVAAEGSSPASLMNAPAVAPARIEEMSVIHRIFRRSFPMAADLVRRTPAGELATRPRAKRGAGRRP